MCGIFGHLALAGRGVDPSLLVGATQRLVHRGPDSGGWWSEKGVFLGHRRLSVIDIETGAQPMFSSTGRHVIVLNGEIYNYLELRRELIAEGIRFRTSSDTEVVLEGYRCWGVDFIHRLSGMFAFAIADRRDGSVVLARDRFGEKPLFIIDDSRNFAFASELAPLTLLPWVDRAVDPVALKQFLCLNYVPGERTLLARCRRLEPGAWMRVGPDIRETGRFWSAASVPALPQGALSVGEASESLERRLDLAVGRIVRADVPVTMLLSGGIDSSLVAAAAARTGAVKEAFVLDFPESSHSELPRAKRVAEHLGLRLERAIVTDGELGDIVDLVGHLDEPLADSSAIAVRALARRVARDYKVALSGDGGDELFGGYLTYRASLLHARTIGRLPMALRRGLVWASGRFTPGGGKVSVGYKVQRFLRAADRPAGEAHFSWNGAWMPEDAERLLSPALRARAPADPLAELAVRHGLDQAPTLHDLRLGDIAEYLPNDILAKVDRATMACGLETRAPMLMPEVADFALSLPDDRLIDGGTTKVVPRVTCRRIFGSAIADAPKEGFSIPIHSWLRGPARPLMMSILSEERVGATGLLDAVEVRREVERHLSGRAQSGFDLWGLMVCVVWHESRIASAPAMPAVPSDLRPIAAPPLDAIAP